MDPMPLESELYKAYESYYTHDTGDSAAARPGRQALVRRVVPLLEQVWLALLFLRSERRRLDTMYLDRLAPGRLLDVGCGEGRQLLTMRSLGWRVEGQDVDSSAAASALRADGIPVHIGPLVDLALPGGSYDAIVANHVIEHVYDPIALLRECHRLLTPGGVLVAVTPNCDSYGHATFGSAWRGLEVPRHLHLFGIRALRRIAAAAGFTKWETWTTAAHAGGICAASLDIQRSGRHVTRGPMTVNQITSAMHYQFMARIVHFRRKDSGEEAILRATR